MKFEIQLENSNLLSVMRRCGYAPLGTAGEAETEYAKPSRGYPRFHMFCNIKKEKKVSCKLHLDQKAPSYPGTHAHSGEYEGPVVETEATRVQRIADTTE